MLGENSRRDLMGACIQEASKCVLNITAAAMHKKLAIVLYRRTLKVAASFRRAAGRFLPKLGGAPKASPSF